MPSLCSLSSQQYRKRRKNLQHFQQMPHKVCFSIFVAKVWMNDLDVSELVLPNTTLLLSRLPPADMSSKQPIPGTTAQQVLEQVYRTTPTATPSATASSKTASSKSAAAAAASSGSGAAGTSTPLSEGAASVGSVPGGAGGMLIKTEPGLVSESAAAGSVASTPTKKVFLCVSVHGQVWFHFYICRSARHQARTKTTKKALQC